MRNFVSLGIQLSTEIGLQEILHLIKTLVRLHMIENIYMENNYGHNFSR